MNFIRGPFLERIHKESLLCYAVKMSNNAVLPFARLLSAKMYVLNKCTRNNKSARGGKSIVCFLCLNEKASLLAASYFLCSRQQSRVLQSQKRLSPPSLGSILRKRDTAGRRALTVCFHYLISASKGLLLKPQSAARRPLIRIYK